jgi:hypothetical protein
MPRSTYFTHGTRNEQILNQSLVDEYIKMFGMDVYYIPRQIIKSDDVLNEVISSQFTDAYLIEAYMENFDGFQGQGDILTKFGIRSNDEVTLVISRQRFEDFVTVSLSTIPGITVGFRPQEGDLIHFPLTDNFFEIKFVEHEDPFYQFGKLYTYKLKCELYEYGDEVPDVGIFDTQVDEGYVIKFFFDELTGSPEIGEEVIGSVSGSKARINKINFDSRPQYVELRSFSGEFVPADILTGASSGATINITDFDELDIKDSYADNIKVENSADGILDFTETNPFGEYGNRNL